MKLYLFRPADDAVRSDEDRFELYLDTVVETVADRMRPEADASLIGVWDSLDIEVEEEDSVRAYGGRSVESLSDRDTLIQALYDTVDPVSPYSLWVRSQITCRFVFMGSDGKAFLCLRNDDPPLLLEAADVHVEECSHLLIDTNFFDGNDAGE
jgi:hypothetical protein